ncbi:phosphatase PAP2 family protein [Nocardia sp. NPDC051750]|uniref:phosphatase PAP2 family protein n=1 Tax=Nocardia sp. NPDC051750 TaxID=3364325 RepID=UPI0037986436
MVFLAALLFVGFMAATGFVLAGDALTGLDRPVYEWVLGRREEPFTTAATVITHAGGSVMMWALALLACGWLLWRGDTGNLALVAGVGMSSAILVPVSKHLIDRPRPPVGNRLVEVGEPSFPSGHSTGAAAVIGVLAAVVYLRSRHRTAARMTAVCAAVFVALVGLTRIYLGVHWTTDVLAGWALGALLVVLGVLVRGRFGEPGSRRGRGEPSPGTAHPSGSAVSATSTPGGTRG